MSEETFRSSVIQTYVRRTLEIGVQLQVGEVPKDDLRRVVEAACRHLAGLLPQAPHQAIKELIAQLRLNLETTPEEQPTVVQTIVRAIQLAQWHLDNLDD